MVTENPEETVGGHAPVRAELSGRRSDSPPQELRKRNSTAPLLEPTETHAKGSEFTGEICIRSYMLTNMGTQGPASLFLFLFICYCLTFLFTCICCALFRVITRFFYLSCIVILLKFQSFYIFL